MSLFAELKRRQVFKVATAYLIVAWIILQVTDLAAPALRLPEWVPSFVLFPLIVGFPVAIVLAWAFEVTPGGIRKTESLPLGDRVRAAGSQTLNFAIIGLLLVAVALLAIDRYRQPDATTAATAEERLSIAVLPFDNLSSDPDQQHFADGLTEELLNSLAALDELRVISRTSSFAFRDQDLPIREIADTLDVGHILEGSVRRVGDRLRITAQLIDTDTDSHLWSENYDESLSVDNILEIQESIAEEVAAALKLKLLPGSIVAVQEARPENLVALDQHLDGMSYLRLIETGAPISEETFQSAVEHFEAAINADPDWAPPRAALGRVYHFRGTSIGGPEHIAQSRRHIEDALAIDPDHGPARSSLAFLEMISGDFDSAMRNYDRAEAAGTNVSRGRALLLRAQGRLDEAIGEYREAMHFDPLSIPVRFQAAEVMVCSGRYDDAFDELRWLEQRAANQGRVHALLAKARVRDGQVEAGLDAAAKAAELIGSARPVALVYALAGERERARAALEPESSESYFKLVEAARAEIALGNEARGLDIVGRAIDRYGEDLTVAMFLGDLRCYPELRHLSGRPAYDRLIARFDP